MSRTAIDLLRSEFAFVVIDTGAGLDEHCLAAIERSTDLVFVGSTDVAGVRNVRKEIDVLDRLGLDVSPTGISCSTAPTPRSASIHSDIEGFIGMPIDVLVPSSRLVPMSNNEGAPLLARRAEVSGRPVAGRARRAGSARQEPADAVWPPPLLAPKEVS